MSKATTSDDAGFKEEKVLTDDTITKCIFEKDSTMVYSKSIVVSDANQIGSSVVREWDRAVGLCVEEGVVLAAHRLDAFNLFNIRNSDYTLICSMTGEQPVLAEKAIQALTGKIKELKEKGSLVKKAAQFVPKLRGQMKIEDLIEFLAVGLDLDEERNLHPCLFYAIPTGYVKTDAYATGLGSIYSQSVLDMLFNPKMSLDEGRNLALTAIYSAAFCNVVKGQAFEAVHVCVITSESTTILRYGVKVLHEKYAPMLKEREEKLRRNPVPRHEYTISDSDSEDEDW